MDYGQAISHSITTLSLDVSIKPFQKEVIESYMDGTDVFCVAGTGCGKSLTYILCPLLFDYQKFGNVTVESLSSIVLIIQPLKALMNDQHTKLISLGLKSTYVGEDHDYDGMSGAGYNYIIASPETAVSANFKDLLQSLKKNIVCLFIDESHCIQSL